MKTVSELAQEWVKKSPRYSCTCDQCTNQMIFGAFMEGYKAADKQQFTANYNDHKLKEAEKTINKLHGRLGELTLRFDNVSVILEEVESLCRQWHSDDQVFEHHGKVSPWAGFFPVKKDD